MPDYTKKHSFRKPFNKGGGDRFGAGKTMHKAECSSCHAACEVPFRPNGKKPVFCSNCFVKDTDGPARESYGAKREFSPRPSYDRPSFNRPAPPAREDRSMHEVKAQLQGVNDKLERLIRLMEAAPAKVTAEAVVKPAKKAAKKKK
jgi:CxxC-x17-CxxC domain-containing protein